MFKTAIVGLLCFLLITVPLTSSGRAWSFTGHKITGYIAWERMTPATREAVIEILRDAPEDSHLSALYIPYGSGTEMARKRDFFMLATTWADIIRERDFPNRNRKYHHSNWHYSDTFWSRSSDGSIQVLKAPEDGGLALERLREYDALIRSQASNEAKAVAIAWLMHIIGDVHQPLHTSARVTELEPKGDQGGNLFHLTPQGTPREQQENLHWYWDSIIERSSPNRADLCDAEYVIPIARKLLKEHPYEKFQGRLDPGQYSDWIAGSLRLAQSDVFSPELVRFQRPSQKYQKNAHKVARERLTMAGYRIGDLLNQVFGKGPAPQEK